MDCRDPEYKDVLIDITLRPIKSSIKSSEWMRYECHPWRLDSGTNLSGTDLHLPAGRQAG